MPIHAVGLQSHMTAKLSTFDVKAIQKFCAAVASMGLRIMVTELDMLDNIAGDVATRDRVSAEVCRVFLDTVLACPAVDTIVMWGLSDAKS